MLLGDLLRHGQPQAGAARLGGEERVEDPFHPLRRDPVSRVVDLERDEPLLRPGRHVETSARRHGLAGIAQQVEQELPELGDVGEHPRQPGREGRRHPHSARLEFGPDEVE